MRARWFASASLCLLALVPAGPGAAAKAGNCRTPKGYRVDAKTREAVVLSERKGDGRIYGCLFSVGRHWPLYPAPKYTLSGRYVAYTVDDVDNEGETVYLDVRNLKTGTFPHSQAVYKHPNYIEAEAPSKVADITLKRNGSVAWISCFTNYPQREACFPPDPDIPFQLWRADKRGRKLVDKSAEIDRHSLTRKGSRITWLRAGRRHTASLR